ARSASGTASQTTGKWVASGTVFYLQDVSGGLPLTSANTLATVTVTLTTNGCQATTITANPNPIMVCDGTGFVATTLTWTSAVKTVQVRVNSPTGPLLAASHSGTSSAPTGKWVTNGMIFYLQDVSGGLPLVPANTLATVKVTLTTVGCPSPVAASISAGPNPIATCDNSPVGVTTLTWTTGTAAVVEVHVGTPNGPLFARSAPGTRSQLTGQW